MAQRTGHNVCAHRLRHLARALWTIGSRQRCIGNLTCPNGCARTGHAGPALFRHALRSDDAQAPTCKQLRIKFSIDHGKLTLIGLLVAPEPAHASYVPLSNWLETVAQVLWRTACRIFPVELALAGARSRESLIPQI